MTLGEAVERYYTTILLPKNNPTAAQRERYILNRMAETLGEHTPLIHLTMPTIVAYRDSILAEGKAPARSIATSHPL